MYVVSGSSLNVFLLKMDKHLIRRATHYKALGIDRSANTHEIKQAYLLKCKELHPDLNKGNKDMHRKFVEVNEAYQVLSDFSKRSQYDQGLSNGVQHPYRSTYHPTTTEFYPNDQSPSSEDETRQIKLYIPLAFAGVFLLIYSTVLYIVYKRRQLHGHSRYDYYQAHGHGRSLVRLPVYDLWSHERNDNASHKNSRP